METKKTTTTEFSRNVEQLIYSAYGWEKEIGFNVVKEFWDSSAKYCKSVVEEDDDQDETDSTDMEDVVTMFGNLDRGGSYVAVKRGAITRRWSIGEAADVLFKTLPMRRFMAKNYDESHKPFSLSLQNQPCFAI